MKKTLLVILLAVILLSSCASAANIHVGAGYAYATISSGMAAATSGDTVYVHKGTYTLASPVTLKGGVTVQGDGYDSTTVRATDKAEFASESEPALFVGNSISNIEISGIKFQGPASSVSDIHDSSQTYYGGHDEFHSAIKLTSVTNARIHDCYATLLLSDFARISGCSYLYIYNNIINTSGHDGAQIYNSKNVWVYNNYISIMINCGVRLSACSGGNLTVAQNTFTSGLANSGWTCVQLQESGTAATVTKNVFTRTTDNYPCAGYNYAGSGSTVSNNIGYSIPSTFLYNLGSVSSSNNSVYSTEYNWAAWGYGYNAADTIGGGTETPSPDPDPDPAPAPSPYDGDPLPTLVSPAAGATVAPGNGHISFTWSNVGSAGYNLLVATDSGFSSIISDTSTTSTAVSVAVNDNATYYWKVRAYNDTGAAWATFTSARSVNTTTSAATLTGLYGLVYTSTSETPIPGAVVVLSNDSWSQSYVTAENGYYDFSIVSGTGVYYLTVTATDYISPQYQMPINSSEYMEKNIALAKAPTYFQPHRVKLIITDSGLMHRYSEATVDVFTGEGDDTTYTGTTGDDGSITFELEEEVKYRIETTYNNITNTDYIIPSSSTYYIIIATTDNSLVGEQFYENITLNVAKNEFNTTTAFINATYLDNTSRTTAVTYILGYTENNGTFVEMNNSGPIAGSNSSYSFTVSDYLGKDYIVKFEIDHETFGSTTKAFAVAFGANHSPFAEYKELSYLGIFILFIVATQFGRQEHASGSVLLCAMAWFMYFIGMFRPLGDTMNGLIFAGTIAATFYAVVAYINSTRDGVY